MTLAAALLFALHPYPAIGACPAAPMASPDDLTIRFPASQGIWIGPAAQMADAVTNSSTQVEGVLVYDNVAKALKLCDGNNWIDLAATGGSASAVGATGYIQFSDGAGGLAYSGTTAGQQLFWDNNNKRLGIGTATPGVPLHVLGSIAQSGSNVVHTLQSTGQYQPQTVMTAQHGSSAPSYLIFDKKREEAVVQSGDSIGMILWRGWDGAGINNLASILASVDGTPGATNDMPGRITFSTSQDGSATLTERMRINNAGNVGIGTVPAASAILDVSSTTKGFLPPRMTTAQRDAIASPTTGLVIFNTTTNKLNVREAGAWAELGVPPAFATVPLSGSGTWTKPTSGHTTVRISCWGGGGGAGRYGSGAGGAGGGGGGYMSVMHPLDKLPASITYVVGAGGAATPTNGGTGTAGGATNFGTYCQANGGDGGRGYQSGGAGGTVPTLVHLYPAITEAGGAGGNMNATMSGTSRVYAGGGGGACGSACSGSLGGASTVGGAGGNGQTAGGQGGTAPGGGGGGGGANQAGGAGANGLIEIEMW